jgi:hypothetical protein
MRLTAKLVRVAALVAAAAAVATGCSSKSESNVDCSANPAPTCGCLTTATITATQACQMLREAGLASFLYAATGPTCRQVCPNQPSCSLPASYLNHAQELNPDASAAPEDGGPPVVNCATGPAAMTVTCGVGCG